LSSCYPDEAAEAAAFAATMAARYQAEQGLRAFAETLLAKVLAARLRVLGPDHPGTLTTSNWLAHLDGQKNT